MTWQARSQRRAELPANWPAIRLNVLKRDKWTCRLCGAYANQADHIGDKYDHNYGNLRALCGPCHGKRTAQQGVAVRAARRARARLPKAPHPGEVR